MADQGQLQYKVFREWKGCNTQAQRFAIPEDNFYYLENLQPIGPANCHSVPAIGAAIIDYGSDTIYQSQSVNVGTKEYQIQFATNGKVFAFDVAAGTSAQINAGNLLNTDSSGRCAQWANNTVLFIDSAGFYVWSPTGIVFQADFHTSTTMDGIVTTWATTNGDTLSSPGNLTPGTTVSAGGGTASVTLSGAALANAAGQLVTNLTKTFAKLPSVANGPPSAGVDIAVFNGQVWIVNGRLLYYSGATAQGALSMPYSTGAGSPWAATAGAGVTNLNDPTLRSTVTRLWATNGYLYYFGNTSIHVIADVKFVAGTPPVYTFSNFNIHKIVGTDKPFSLFMLNRTLIFANEYGIHALDGTTVQRISEPIDGTWQYVDLTLGMSGGAVVLNNILCAATLISVSGDPILGTRTIMATFFNGKWWFTNMGSLTYVVSSIKNSLITLYGFIGNKLYQLFADASNDANITMLTALWPMEDNLLTKQVTKAGVEMNIDRLNSGSTFSIYCDSENNSQAVNASSGGNLLWTGSGGSALSWTGSGGGALIWLSAGFFNVVGTVAQFGKYVGVRFTTTGGSKVEVKARTSNTGLA